MTGPRRSRSERGAAALLTVAMAGVLVLVGAALGVVGAVVATHRQAQAAADLAAVAGARSVAEGHDACVVAADLARANGASLTGCAVDGRDVRVAVRVRGPRWLGLRADLDAEARAGPAR